MIHKSKSIRSFIGAKDFKTSRQFYLDLGCIETPISNNMSYFMIGNHGFYLQDAYVKDWVDNTMIFLEVDDVERYHTELSALGLHDKYKLVRLLEFTIMIGAAKYSCTIQAVFYGTLVNSPSLITF